MQFRPTAAELLDAIAELLESEVVDALTGPLQHRARVAANLARILQREAELGPAVTDGERKVLGELLGTIHDGHASVTDLRAELAARLRRGPLDHHNDNEVWAALLAITKADLSISKPGHADWIGDVWGHPPTPDTTTDQP